MFEIECLTQPDDLAEAHAAAAREPPASELEQLLAALWWELLGVPAIGRDTEFDDAGGNSLIAAQLAARLGRMFRLDLSVIFPFQHPTVAAMAERITQLRRSGAYARSDAIPPRSRSTPAPVTFGQEQLWYVDKLGDAGRAYHYQATIDFTGELDVRALRRALTEIVRRHEILRTVYEERKGQVEQVVLPPYDVDLSIEDLRVAPDRAPSEALERALRLAFAAPFDLGELPLIRWKLYRTGERAWTLAEVEHHILHDGWSVAVMWREVGRLYRAFATATTADLPAMTVQMGDYAVWQRRRYERRRVSLLRHWRVALDGASTLDLPIARMRPAARTFHGATRRVVVPFELYRQLRRFSRERRCSLFMTLLAGYFALLHRYTGGRDLCVGSWLANRDRTETEQLIGMLVNLVAIRCAVGADDDVTALLARVREAAMQAYAHQDAPFHEVVRAVDPHRDPSRNPLVQTCFSFHDSPVPELDWPGVTGRLVERSNGSARFDLDIVAIPQAEQRRVAEARPGRDDLILMWAYNTDLFDGAAMDRMIEHYQQLLRVMVAAPQRRIGDLPVMTSRETLPRSEADI